MLKTISKLALFFVISILLLLLFFAVLFLTVYKNLPEKINDCYEKNNDKLWDNITTMQKNKLGKEESCLLWKESIKELNTCFEITFKTKYFTLLPLEHVKNLQKLKEKQNESCKAYPNTWIEIN